MKKLILAFTAFLAMSTSAFAEIGSADKDLVFTPITPCRIMDTRNPGAASGVLAAGSIRTFYANSITNNYFNQGGNVPTCGLPFTSNVAAVVLNFTVVSPAANGYITAFPANVADIDKPLAATVNFAAGAVVGNNATLKISQLSSDGRFKIYSSTSTHVVADIVGYYAMPVATALGCVEVVSAGITVGSGASAQQTTPACSASYSITGGGCSSSTYDGRVATSRTMGVGTANQFHVCSFRNEGAGSATFTAYALCCRIPGR